jgi:hypothetical protein
MSVALVKTTTTTKNTSCAAKYVQLSYIRLLNFRVAERKRVEVMLQIMIWLWTGVK